MINFDNIIESYKKKAAANKVAAETWEGANKDKEQIFLSQNELIAEFIKTLDEIKSEIKPLLEA